MNVIEQFENLCGQVADSFVPTLGEDELEPLYEKVLNFMKSHEGSREELVASVIKIMSQYRESRNSDKKLLPSTAIAYCMHELRWPEIRDFADSENRNFYSKTKSTLMTEILDAYSDDWVDREFYRRFG